jgi:hypothetical protein
MSAGAFSKFALPIIRKTYPKLIASAIVNVQPMTAPTSLLHYLRHKYQDLRPADPEIYGAILLWFRSNLTGAKIIEADQTQFVIQHDGGNDTGKCCMVRCYLRWCSVLDEKLDYDDPEFFTKAAAVVAKFFENRVSIGDAP